MSEELSKALRDITRAGYQVSKTGFDFLSRLTDDTVLRQLVQYSITRANTIPDDAFVLDDEFFSLLLQEINLLKEATSEVSPKVQATPLAKEYEPRVQVRTDPTNELEPDGSAQAFLDYFRDRYDRIEKIFKRRIDARDAVSISQALKMPQRQKSKVVGIVTNKRISENKLFLDVEDKESSATVLISSNTELMRRAKELLLDQVVCLQVSNYREGLLVADDLLFPEVPDKEPNRSDDPLWAVLISDLHVGSKLFMNQLCENFIKWLRMQAGSEHQRDIAGRVKYIVLAGDLVDGIGVYPEQEGELAITSLEKQYEAAENLLCEIPEYIQLIIIPGNHDAVRKSLPQPAIPRRYLERLYHDDRTMLLGDPSALSLHGVEFLVSHGKCLDDVLTQVPGLDFQHPAKGMELLLRARHLSPIYGSTTPIAPQKRDWMVIESPPDILQMGHIHVFECRKYRDTLLVNSGTMQSQTSYQKRMGVLPRPGLVPVADLQKLQVEHINLNSL